MIDLAIAFLFLSVALGAIYWFVVLVPTRREFKIEMRRVRVEANHQDLFILVNDLLAIHERGYQVIFPDNETLDRAKRLSNTYRTETTG